MSVMDNQQFVVGKDIDFEFGDSPHYSQTPEAVENPAASTTTSSKKKKKKKKKKSSSKTQVRVHSDGQGLTINNIDATMESDLLEAANTVAKSLGAPASSSGSRRPESLKWSMDRLELVANRSKQALFSSLTLEQEEQVRQFFISLPSSEQLGLLRLDKERQDVMRIDRKLSEATYMAGANCPCSVCGQRRGVSSSSGRGGEMEHILNEYMAELIFVAKDFLQGPLHDDSDERRPSGPSDAPLTPEVLDVQLQNSSFLSNMGLGNDTSSYDEEDIREEAELLAEMTAERRKQKGSRLSGGILSVADDLLRNDGKRFVDVMEHIAECKIVREISMAARHDMARDDAGSRVHECDLDEEGGFDDEDFDDEDEDFNDEDEDDDGDIHYHDHDGYEHDYNHNNEDHSGLGEPSSDDPSPPVDYGKVLLRNFARRTFEYRVLMAFRDHMAKERQKILVAELEAEEARVREEKELKKIKEREKRKDKKKAQQKLKEEERARKEQERRAKEEAQRAKEEAQRLARLEEQRLKQEAHRAQIEERLKKLALEEEREKERLRQKKELEEKERLEKERLEKARLEKERSEKERLEKERLEKQRLEKQRLEKELLEKQLLEKASEKERFERQKLNPHPSAEPGGSILDTPCRQETPTAEPEWPARTEDEHRGWSPLNGLYQSPSLPRSTGPAYVAPAAPQKQWQTWQLGSPPPMQVGSLVSPSVAVNTLPHGGSLWSSQSIWSTTSLDGVQTAALSSYDRLVFEGAAVDGYIPSQILFQATVQALGNSRLSQSDFYSACGVTSGTGPFYGLRDSVGLITHMCRK